MRVTSDKNKATAVISASIIFGMLGLSFAAVPLYKAFCQKTGFGGTPKIVASPYLKGAVLNRKIRIQFNADTNPALPWRFHALQHEIPVQVGENALAFYQAQNLSDTPITGMATYNVTPDKAGKYFSKIVCFCFIEQILTPGQVMDMPVQFYLDPEIAKDPDCDDIKVITLSYTFHPYKKGMMGFESPYQTAASPTAHLGARSPKLSSSASAKQ